uniref:Uncharacterized protein n=1 Tax=Malurus cyaneus samueli TaxID=2593467 RepID=A0A8C5TRY7_9PASS
DPEIFLLPGRKCLDFVVCFFFSSLTKTVSRVVENLLEGEFTGKAGKGKIQNFGRFHRVILIHF